MHRQQPPNQPQPSMSISPSQTCHPITFIIGQIKCEYLLPSSWSICKVKCLLVTQYPQLNFDKFELMCCGKRLLGEQKIMEINSDSITETTLVVFNTKSEITFNQYYTYSISRHMQRKYQPIMHPDYQKTLSVIENQPIGLDQNHNLNQQFEWQDNFLRLMKILQLIGWGFFSYLVLSKGQYYQIVCIFLLVSTHFFIQLFQKRKRLDRQINPNNNHNNTIKKTKQQQTYEKNIPFQPTLINQIKVWLLIRYYKIYQFICCFLLTLFPNFDLQLHHQLMEDRVRQWREEIEQLRPGTYKGEWTIR